MCGGRWEGRFGELGRGQTAAAVASGRKKGGLHLHPPSLTSSGNAGRSGVFALLKVENQGGLLPEGA